ncbi:DUF885 domain-containing protein [Pseudonocardia sp.]|uniref:DUF885 domain-containing protein n=1 Tax=Pseudonocardia sp. TaxID=60912 RepID=UPI003D0C4874
MLDGSAAEYAALAARVDRLLPGTARVPAELRHRVAAQPRPRASAIVGEAGRLRSRLAGRTGRRVRVLDAQLRALECTARGLAGQEIGFRAEVATVFGVEIHPGEPDVYAAAHRVIGELLPGRGPVLLRWAAHRRRDEVPRALLLPAVGALAAALRTRVTWPLPPGEVVRWRLVDRAPWTALHTGDGTRSVVTLNAGARLRWSALPGLVAHEAYPGHHVQSCRAACSPRPEDAVTLVRGPRAVLDEGAADAGFELLAGPDWGMWTAAVLGEVVRDALRGRYGEGARDAAAGVPAAAGGVPFDGELARLLAAAALPLQAVRQDAALLLHDRRSPFVTRPAAARDHLLRWLPLTRGEATRIVEGLGSPLWRGHVVTHVQGPPLVNGWLRGTGSPVDRYLRLLDEPLLPRELGRSPRAERPARSPDARPALFRAS